MTSKEQQVQWHNPHDVLSVLLIIGGDVIQTALAQLSGPTGYWIVPVSFSFGWVSYGFMTLLAVAGDGRLMPEPDYTCKVINARSVYARENRSWVLGRVLRDFEILQERGKSHADSAMDQEDTFVVGVFQPDAGKKRPSNQVILEISIWALTFAVQLALALIPVGQDNYWGVLFVTLAGTALACLTGLLPQWRAEKWACRWNSTKEIVLTQGNGARAAMVIVGNGTGPDLEDVAGSASPYLPRSWQRYAWFRSKPKKSISNSEKSNASETQPLNPSDSQDLPPPAVWNGLPADYWFSVTCCTAMAIAWIVLLIFVAGLGQHSWYLLAVGMIGMLQNVVAAAGRRTPEARGLPLAEMDTFHGRKVMDVIMDVNCKYPQVGNCLREEFFPGKLRPSEVKWWARDHLEYDVERYKNRGTRGEPRSTSADVLEEYIANEDENDS